MIADKARDYYDKKAKERMQVRKGDQPGASVETLPPLGKAKARDQAGKAAGVSGRTMDKAKHVAEMAGPRPGLPLGTRSAILRRPGDSWGLAKSATRRTTTPVDCAKKQG